MSNEDILKSCIFHLADIPGFWDFYENYILEKKIISISDIYKFNNAFKNHFTNKGIWNEKFDLILKILDEQSHILTHQNISNPLSFINTSIKINDAWIIDYCNEFKKCLTGEVYVDEIKPRRYITISEKIILKAVDHKKLHDIYSKYSIFNHPYVNYQISSIYNNSKYFSQGLPILKEGIKSAVSYPYMYWNNEYGIYGTVWMITDLLYMLNNENFQSLNLISEEIKLLKLLYLYISRYIFMTNSNANSIDFYSNRANIMKRYYVDFVGIFWPGVNPDIQYISDMYLAYYSAVKNNIPIIDSIWQFYLDSMKMYRYESHQLNYTGGLKDSEDMTWNELIVKGEIRSMKFSNDFLKSFENYKLNIKNEVIDKLFNYLAEKNEDNFTDYLNKINNHRIR